MDSVQLPNLKTKDAIWEKQWFRKKIFFEGYEIKKENFLSERNSIFNRNNFNLDKYKNLIIW